MKKIMMGMALAGALLSVGCGGSSGCDACSGDTKDACEAAVDLCKDAGADNCSEIEDAAEDACK